MAKKALVRDPEYLSIKEVGQTFNVSIRQVKIALEEKLLRGAKVGRSWIIRKSEAIKWLKKQEQI